MKITCPVPQGNEVILVSQTLDGTKEERTIYKLVWTLNTHDSATQIFPSHTTAGIQRTYYLISVTPDQLTLIKAGQVSPNGDYYTLNNAPHVSQDMPNKT